MHKHKLRGASTAAILFQPVAHNLRACREAAGLSRAQLATESGVSLSAIRSIEVSGTKNPLISTLLDLAKALGITIDQLCGMRPLVLPRLANNAAGGPHDQKL